MTENEQFEVVTASDRDCYFVPVFHDFLDSTLLNGKEKIIYIMLKRYLKLGTHSGEVYPCIDTLCKQSGMRKPTVIGILKSLQEKKILHIQRRGLNKPNLYTLYDTKNLWKAQTIEEVDEAIEEELDRQQSERLRSRGYIIQKAKEPDSLPTKAEKQTLDNQNNIRIYNDIKNIRNCQEGNLRYSEEDIKILYEYEYLIQDERIGCEDVETVIQILLDALNTTKPTIRIDREEKPSMVVISKLLKLDMNDIIFAINQYHQQRDRIQNVNAYLLTILYHAKEQNYLDLMNLGHHNNDF